MACGKYTLYASDGCVLVPKIEMAAALANLQLTKKDEKSMPVDNLAFVRRPSISGAACGGTLPGSNAALRHIANLCPSLELYGQSLADRAQVDALLDAANAELEQPVMAAVTGKDAKAAEKVATALKNMDKCLAKSSFLVGHRLTIADICVAGMVKAIDEKKICSLAEYPQVVRVANTCFGRAGMKYTVACGDACKSAGSAAVSDASTSAPASSDPAVEAPKPKDAQDLLPGAALDLENFKRKYSNSKDLKTVMEEFCQEIKPEEDQWSFWKLQYLPCGETDCQDSLRMSNFVGGFFQRMDTGLRKHTMGVMDVLEAKDSVYKYDVTGVLVTRGKTFPKRLSEHVQIEADSFKVEELSLTNPEHKAFFIDMFIAEDNLADGTPIKDSKVYK